MPHRKTPLEKHGFLSKNIWTSGRVVKGPYVTLARDFQLGASLKELAAKDRLDGRLLSANWSFGEDPLYLRNDFPPGTPPPAEKANLALFFQFCKNLLDELWAGRR